MWCCRSLADEIRVAGESQIPHEPGHASAGCGWSPTIRRPFPRLSRPCLSADLIIIGPGSLYTSLLPNLLVPDMADAIRVSRAFKVYICNIATQRGEKPTASPWMTTSACSTSMSVGACSMWPSLNSNYSRPPCRGISNMSRLEMTCCSWLRRWSAADLVDEMHPWRHDPRKLSQIMYRICIKKKPDLW